MPLGNCYPPLISDFSHQRYVCGGPKNTLKVIVKHLLWDCYGGLSLRDDCPTKSSWRMIYFTGANSEVPVTRDNDLKKKCKFLWIKISRKKNKKLLLSMKYWLFIGILVMVY